MTTPTETTTASTPIVAVLTDGTGLSRLTGSKVLKDLVVDFLLTLTSTFGVVQIVDLSDAISAPQQALMAIASAAIRVVYRALMRWGTTPS
jgi:hypothetical protein